MENKTKRIEKLEQELKEIKEDLLGMIEICEKNNDNNCLNDLEIIMDNYVAKLQILNIKRGVIKWIIKN